MAREENGGKRGVFALFYPNNQMHTKTYERNLGGLAGDVLLLVRHRSLPFKI
jgi:hypothetical protein